jgi:hypothetical protein
MGRLPPGVAVSGKRTTRLVEFLSNGGGVWSDLSPEALASLIRVVQGRAQLSEAHISVVRLFHEGAPL